KTNLETQIATEDLAVAALIHSELMSIRLPSVSYACLKGKTMPCRGIGGDFFDAIALTDSLCAVVADVSGKGAPAAIVAAMLQGIIHAQMLADQPLTAIAGMVNEFLCSRATGKFATMVLLKVRANGEAEYVNCGHVPPVLVNCASVRRLEGSNVVVGLIAAAQYKSEVCELMQFDLQTHLNKLALNFSDSVVRHAYTNIRSILNNAVDLDFITKSPARRLHMPETRTPDKSVIPAATIMQLHGAITDPMDRCAFAIAVFCALRTSEVFGLTWGCCQGEY